MLRPLALLAGLALVGVLRVADSLFMSSEAGSIGQLGRSHANVVEVNETHLAEVAGAAVGVARLTALGALVLAAAENAATLLLVRHCVGGLAWRRL